jgi:hypothetical protein
MASTFDPSFFEQTLQGNARVWKLFGFHPAAASQPLHERSRWLGTTCNSTPLSKEKAGGRDAAGYPERLPARHPVPPLHE